MAATPKNKFWLARSSHGRKPKFEDPEVFLAACQEYFEWCENNPLIAVESSNYQGVFQLNEVPKMRVMTLTACCSFLDITLETWNQYRKREDFSEPCSLVEQFIRDQKFGGASAGFFNPMIIARDLGLRDNVSTEVSGPDGGPIKSAAVVLGTNDPNEAAQAYQQLMNGEK